MQDLLKRDMMLPEDLRKETEEALLAK